VGAAETFPRHIIFNARQQNIRSRISGHGSEIAEIIKNEAEFFWKKSRCNPVIIPYHQSFKSDALEYSYRCSVNLTVSNSRVHTHPLRVAGHCTGSVDVILRFRANIRCTESINDSATLTTYLDLSHCELNQQSVRN